MKPNHLFFIIFYLLCNTALAEIVVVVHPENTATINERAVRHIYLNKLSRFSNGDRVIPLSRPKGSDITKVFSQRLLKKKPAQLRAYWAKLIFTGRGKPPKEIKSDQKVIELVSENPEYIGFVSRKVNTDKVRVVIEL